MQHKKIKYVPGLISLLGLPLLLLLIGPGDPKWKTSIRLFLPRDTLADETRLTTGNVYEKIKNKHITSVDFWYWHSHNERDEYVHYRKLHLIRNEIERLSIVHDTSRVLKIEFGEGASYGEFIWILNQLMINHVRRYVLVENTFYVFANDIPIDPFTHPPLEIDMSGYAPVIDDTKSPTWWDWFLYDLENQLEIWHWYLQYNYVLIPGFILLIVIPFFFRIKRYLRYSKYHKQGITLR